VKFCVFTISENLVSTDFNSVRMNSNRPLPSLNPGAERVSYSPVFHLIELRAELKFTQARQGGLDVTSHHHDRGFFIQSFGLKSRVARLAHWHVPRRLNVRFWHKADIAIALNHVLWRVARIGRALVTAEPTAAVESSKRGCS